MSRSSNSPSHLIVGTLGRAVGLRGEIEVLVHSDDPRRFEPGSRLLLDGDLVPVTIGSRRTHRGRLVVAFDEVTDREGAEALRGRDVVVAAEAARTLEPGQYWDHDLIGSRVVATSGEEVGEVTDVLHPPANDVLVVRGGPVHPGEHLVPLVASIVVNVDVAAGTVTIDPLPGLLEGEDR